MKSRLLITLVFSSVLLMTGCSSGPVRLGPSEKMASDYDFRRGRPIYGGGCGFQLLMFFPININSRFQRAYDELVYQAGGDFIRDIKIREAWWYGYVGTVHCTHLAATAYPQKTHRRERDFNGD